MIISTLSLLNFIIYLVLPISIAMLIWRNRDEDLLKWILLVGSGGICIVSLVYLGAYFMIFTGYYSRYFVIFLFFVSSVKSYLNTKRTFLPFSKKQIPILMIYGSICGLQIWRMCVVFCSSFQVPEGVHLAFPLKNGEYSIVGGGNNSIINHHFEVDAQRYAIDIIKINKFGVRYNNLISSDLTNYNIFGDTIYSPCNGKIVELVDGLTDLEPGTMDSENLAGNHLVIEMEDDKTAVVLAHIMKGSYLVKKGDTVQEDQPLAKVGNSGNTTEPHLHIHAVSKFSEDLISSGDGIPMRFNDQFLSRNDRIYSDLSQ